MSSCHPPPPHHMRVLCPSHYHRLLYIIISFFFRVFTSYQKFVCLTSNMPAFISQSNSTFIYAINVNRMLTDHHIIRIYNIGKTKIFSTVLYYSVCFNNIRHRCTRILYKYTFSFKIYDKIQYLSVMNV